MRKVWYRIKFIARKALEILKIPFFLLFDSVVYLHPAPKIKRGSLILKCDAIGDYILFRNFIQFYKSSLGEITFLTRSTLHNLYQELDALSEENLISINPGKFETNLIYRINLLKKVRKLGFKNIIQINFSRYYFIEDSIIRLSGAKMKIGVSSSFNNIGAIPQFISKNFYHKYYELSNKVLFEFIRNKEIAEKILGLNINESFQLPYRKKTKKDSDYIVISPGAGAPYRQWPSWKYAKLINQMANVFTSEFKIIGSNHDLPIASDILSHITDKNIIEVCCGNYNLTETIHCIANSNFLIANESGNAHIGAATQTITICISNGNHFGRFHPYPKIISDKIFHLYPDPIEEKIRAGQIDTLKKQLKIRSLHNIDSISTDQVLSKILEVIN